MPPNAVPEASVVAGSTGLRDSLPIADTKLMGSGSFGSVVRVKMTTENTTALGKIMAEMPIKGKPLPMSGYVALKLQVLTPFETRRAMAEANIQNYLSKKSCFYVGDKSYCPSSLVPRLHFAGPLEEYAADDKRFVFVICMELVEGVTLYDHLTSAPFPLRVTRKLVAALEHAVATLWASGVVHGDLHSDNIMLTSDSIKIIDFGFAVYVPDHGLSRETIQEAVRLGKLEDLWYSGGLQAHVDLVMRRRGQPRYHANGKFLRELHAWRRQAIRDGYA
jgi:serine/threonine protein kinase